MTLLEFSMSPFDKGESLSEHVAKILQHIDESGVSYKLTPMGTIMEGEWDDLMRVVTECFRIMEKHSSRISVNIKIDHRAGAESRLKSKISKVEDILQRPLKS